MFSLFWTTVYNDMVVSENPSRLKVSKILGPAHLAPTAVASSNLLKAPFFILNLSTSLKALSYCHVINGLDIRVNDYLNNCA